MALQFHPDKNHAPGADDVFKAISRAFACLSDGAKKRQYDQFGAEPAAGRPGSNGSGHAGSPFAFQGDINPEDIFRAFFGGGGGGSPFGGGQFHSFNMGGGGNPFGFHHQFQQRQRAHAQAQANRGPASDFDRLRALVRQMLPLIIFFAFSIISSWLGSWDRAGTSGASSFDDIADLVSLSPSLGFRYPRSTHGLKIHYYATSPYQAHFKAYDEAVARNRSPPHKLQRELHQYESIVEKTFVKDLQRKCKAETGELNEKMKQASKNPAELLRLKRQSKPACDKLHALGIK